MKIGAQCFGDFCAGVSIKDTLVALKVVSYCHVETFGALDYEPPTRAALKSAGCGVKAAAHVFFSKYWCIRGQSEALASTRDVCSGTSALPMAGTNGACGRDGLEGSQGVTF